MTPAPPIAGYQPPSAHSNVQVRAPEWLTVAEVCHELRIARSTWEKWRQKGAAPKVVRFPNGQLRIRRGWLEDWINQQMLLGV